MGDPKIKHAIAKRSKMSNQLQKKKRRVKTIRNDLEVCKYKRRLSYTLGNK